MEAGLIFVSTSDTIGCIVRAVIKQPYNYIGFFINSEEKGYTQTRIWIIDIFSGKKADWLEDNTLNELQNHYLVDSISIKKLRPIMHNNVTDLELTEINIENFKLSICNALNTNNQLDMVTAIYKLFGNQCLSDSNSHEMKCDLSADDLVQLVFKNLGIDKDIKILEPVQDLNIYLTIKNEPRAILFFNFNQIYLNNNNLYSFLKEDDYFEELEIIETKHTFTRHKPDVYNIQNKDYIDNFFKTFNYLVQHNINFNITLEKGINLKSSSESSEKIIRKLNSRIEELSEITKNLVNDAAKSRRHTVERDIKNILESINKVRTQTNLLYNTNYSDLSLN